MVRQAGHSPWATPDDCFVGVRQHEAWAQGGRGAEGFSGWMGRWGPGRYAWTGAVWHTIGGGKGGCTLEVGSKDALQLLYS